jgi:hypothetical protein
MDVHLEPATAIQASRIAGLRLQVLRIRSRNAGTDHEVPFNPGAPCSPRERGQRRIHKEFHMITNSKRIAMILGLALVASGAAFADDSGDNSMSPWTGESYAAFNGGNFGAPQREPAEAGKKAPEPEVEVIIGLPRDYEKMATDEAAA